MLERKSILTLALAALLIAGLACNLPGFTGPGAAPTEDLTPVATQVASAIKTAQNGGRITLTLTEGQLTSLANQEAQSQPDNPISDIRIRLDDGVMAFSGQAEQDGLSMPISASVNISADAQGRLHTQIISGKLGPFALPQGTLDQLTAQFDAIIQSQLAANAGSLFVENIAIDNGQITITAQIK